jgi:heptosyltransferase-2
MPTLVIQTAFLGDVVLTTSLLSALADQHGPLDVVTTPIAAPLLETHPAVRQVIAYDKRRAQRGWAGLQTMVRRLESERYERVYLPHRSLRSAALALLARIPARIGFKGAWSFLYTEAKPKPRTGHETDRLLALADEPPGAYPPHLRPTPEDEQAAVQVWDAIAQQPRGHFIALAPGSIWGSKRWPYYPELAHRLAARCAAVGSGADDGVGRTLWRRRRRRAAAINLRR